MRTTSMLRKGWVKTIAVICIVTSIICVMEMLIMHSDNHRYNVNVQRLQNVFSDTQSSFLNKKKSTNRYMNGLEENVRYPDDIEGNSKEEQPIRTKAHSYPNSASSAVSKTDDFLRNVSYTDVMQVMDIRSWNNSVDFIKWTEAYMNNRVSNSFEDPSWVHKGKSVCEKDTEMVIIIPAVPSHVFDRQLIRQTWASSIYGMHFPQIRPNSLRTKLAFVFGTSRLLSAVKDALNEEASRYNDVVAADFVDSYGNLSLKMMVGLNWASTFCSGAKYVLKADLDTFINIPLLSRFLLQVSEKIPDYILGHMHTFPYHPVSRRGKWKVERKDYPFESYPPYLLGHSYVITSKLVPLILSAGRRIPLIPPEDALVTGVLARVIQAPRLHHEGFATVSRKVFPCRIVYNYQMTVTRMTASRHVLLWRDVLGNACSGEELS